MKKSDTRDLFTYIGFILPGLLIYLFIIAYPICYSVFLSMTNYNPNLARQAEINKQDEVLQKRYAELNADVELTELYNEVLPVFDAYRKNEVQNGNEEYSEKQLTDYKFNEAWNRINTLASDDLVARVESRMNDLNEFHAMKSEWKLTFMGLKNYKKVVTMNKGIVDSSTKIPEFWYAFKNNMIVVLVSLFGQIPIGFILAFILYRKQVKASNFFQAMVFLPQFLSTIVIGIMWRMLFMVDGPVAKVIQHFSGNPTAQFDLMMQPGKAMIPIGIVLIWMYTGMYMIIFLANLQKINESMFEAAKIDGATEVQIFFKITIPLLAGSILTSCILAIAGSLKGFSLIYALAPEGKQRINTEVLPIYMYRVSFNNAGDNMRYAYGATISNIVVVISILLIIFSNWVGKKLGTDEEY